VLGRLGGRLGLAVGLGLALGRGFFFLVLFFQVNLVLVLDGLLAGAGLGLDRGFLGLRRRLDDEPVLALGALGFLADLARVLDRHGGFAARTGLLEGGGDGHSQSPTSCGWC